MPMELKNQMVAEYIKKFSQELNNQYKGIMNDDKVEEAIEMFTNSENDYETIIENIQKLATKLIEDYLEFQRQLQEFMSKKFEEEQLDVFTLDLNIDLNGLYLSQQQIDLLMIVGLNSKEEIRNYVENICGQFPYKKVEDLIDIDNLSVEECKRKIYELYQESLVGYLENAELTKEQAARIKLSHLGVNGEELEECVAKIKKEALREVLIYLEQKYGQGFITKLNRFIKEDFENIKSVSYEQMADLNEFIRNDSSIDTIVIATGKYNNNVFQTGNGKVFDPYLTQKAMQYCLMTGKHMRYHSLFGHSYVDNLLKEGKGLEDHNQILEEMRIFVKQSFDFIERNNRTMPDGSMFINVVEVFNELVEKNKVDKNSPYAMVWEKYFGITVDEIVSCFDGIKKPTGVEFMYNETTLTESPYKREAVGRVLYQIEQANPSLIDSFGDQMHLSDEDVMSKIGRENLSQTFNMLRRIQDGNLFVNGEVRKINGKKIECTEHDFHFTKGFIQNFQIAENSGHIEKKQVGNVKKNMQAKISGMARESGVQFSRSTYWSIFDRNDHNLCRTNIEIQQENKKLADEKKRPLIDTMHAGLVSKNGFKSVKSLNGTNKNKQTKTFVKKAPNQTNSSNGFADALILALITGFVSGVIFMIVYSFLINM